MIVARTARWRSTWLRLHLALTALLLALAPAQARAAVTITFWSHDFGNYFPHAFFTLRGVPDAGGPAIDASYGFTARAITPAILFGNVGGRVEGAKRGYMEGSHVRFARVLTDAQYGAIVALVREWGEKTGDSTYNLNRRNCVHFVAEAARRAGLAHVAFPRLMKKPGSYLKAVAEANAGEVTVIEMMGRAYLPTLPPLDGIAPVAVPVSAPGTLRDPEKPRPAPAP